MKTLVILILLSVHVNILYKKVLLKIFFKKEQDFLELKTQRYMTGRKKIALTKWYNSQAGIQENKAEGNKPEIRTFPWVESHVPTRSKFFSINPVQIKDPRIFRMVIENILNSKAYEISKVRIFWKGSEIRIIDCNTEGWKSIE